jgi:hypothetical protein
MDEEKTLAVAKSAVGGTNNNRFLSFIYPITKLVLVPLARAVLITALSLRNFALPEVLKVG